MRGTLGRGSKKLLMVLAHGINGRLGEIRFPGDSVVIFFASLALMGLGWT